MAHSECNEQARTRTRNHGQVSQESYFPGLFPRLSQPECHIHSGRFPFPLGKEPNVNSCPLFSCCWHSNHFFLLPEAVGCDIKIIFNNTSMSYFFSEYRKVLFFSGKKSKYLTFESRAPDFCYCFSVAESCPFLSNPMDCSMLGFSVHGIPQVRILER